MKLFSKLLAVTAAMCCGVCAFAFAACNAFAGCNKNNTGTDTPDESETDTGTDNGTDNEKEEKTYSGDYHYDTEYGTYGIKVDVKVEDNVIKEVVVVDSDYIEVSESWSDKSIWEDGLDGLLTKYEGKTVEEVLSINVQCAENGQPESGQEYDGLVITGSTQGSGRLLLAVQDALKNASDKAE